MPKLSKVTVAKIQARSSSWPNEVREQVTRSTKPHEAAILRAAATRTSFLRNVLMRVPEYRRNLAAIKPPPGEEAIPFEHFLVLESPVFTTAPLTRPSHSNLSLRQAKPITQNAIGSARSL